MVLMFFLVAGGIILYTLGVLIYEGTPVLLDMGLLGVMTAVLPVIGLLAGTVAVGLLFLGGSYVLGTLIEKLDRENR